MNAPTTDLMHRFWSAQRARGDAPAKVWGLYSTGRIGQPRGYCVGWSVSRKSAIAQADRISNGCECDVIRVDPS